MSGPSRPLKSITWRYMIDVGNVEERRVLGLGGNNDKLFVTLVGGLCHSLRPDVFTCDSSNANNICRHVAAHLVCSTWPDNEHEYISLSSA